MHDLNDYLLQRQTVYRNNKYSVHEHRFMVSAKSMRKDKLKFGYGSIAERYICS